MEIDQEKVVIAKCKEDMANFAFIYDSYVNDVYRYAFSRLNNKTEAEDITSETFLKALEKFGTYEPQEGKRIKYWLIRISRNLIIDKYRKKEMTEFHEEFTAFEDEDILNKVANMDLLKKIEEFIKEMKPPTPEIVQLRIWDEMSFVEIAEILGKNVPAVKMNYYRALEKIHKEFMTEKINVNG
jgi:RNA polymerase sigma-70 factor (ECF subfamily)